MRIILFSINKFQTLILLALMFSFSSTCIATTIANSTQVDYIKFGDSNSEQVHNLKSEHSEIIEGAKGISARRLLPKEKKNWRGGNISFNVKVNPNKINYITVKFWGSDINSAHSRLMLFIEGKQVGQRHLGEVDELDIMYDYPRNPGNFFYKTLPLPFNMTKGKNEVSLSIEAQGSIWGYGNTIEKYQKNVKDPSRGIYSAHIHTDAYLNISDNDQVIPWNERPLPKGSGEEVLEKVKTHVNKAIVNNLEGETKLDKEAITFLAKAYLIKWTKAYNNVKVIEKLVKAIDLHYIEFDSNRDIVGKTWAGYGGIGEAISLLNTSIKPYINNTITSTSIKRRTGWSDMLKASRDWHAQNRRAYTNQSMIVDMYTYKCNRGLAVLSKEMAWPEEKALRLMYESVGLQPWSGSWDKNDKPKWSKGKNFMQLTDLGLTRELGYVGAYGDIVNDIVLSMYNATRPSLENEGDSKLREQLIKIAKARAIFRYPLADEKGHRTMNIETVIGWRDWYYPGGITYGQMPTREGGPLEIAAATLDPTLLGYGQQILEDNLYFYTLNKKAKGRKYSELISLLDVPQTYEIIKNQETQPARLPMTPGQEDFVFADPEVGALAMKHGEKTLFVSLYLSLIHI